MTVSSLIWPAIEKEAQTSSIKIIVTESQEEPSCLKLIKH